MILACRSVQRAEAARDDITKSTGNDDVIVMSLDLASLRSIQQFADDFNRSALSLVRILRIVGSSERRFYFFWPDNLVVIVAMTSRDLLLFVFLISSILHHHPALLRRHTMSLDRSDCLLTFVVAFSIFVLKFSFS